jgi:hypothetical protein
MADDAGDTGDAPANSPYGYGDRHEPRLDELIVHGEPVPPGAIGPAYEVVAAEP